MKTYFLGPIRRFILIIISYIYAFTRGRAIKLNGNVTNVLVIQMGKLGDMICTTPVFRAIKVKYPDSKVTVLGNKINKQVLDHNTDIDEYLVLGSYITTWKTIRSKRFSCVILVGGPDVMLLSLVYLSKVPLIVAPRVIGGYSPWMTLLYRSLLPLVRVYTNCMGHYVPRQYLKSLEYLGIYSDDTKKHVGNSKDSESSVSRIFQSKGIKSSDLVVGISLGAGNKIKEWLPERFAQVIKYLVQIKHAKVILFGSVADQELVKLAGIDTGSDSHVYSFVGQLSIDELKVAISKLDLYIAADTGPIYIAEAFNIPTIDIVGPIDEREQPPISAIHRIITPPGRNKPELYVMNARKYNKVEARKQVESISVEMVCNTIDDLLAILDNKPHD